MVPFQSRGIWINQGCGKFELDGIGDFARHTLEGNLRLVLGQVSAGYLLRLCRRLKKGIGDRTEHRHSDKGGDHDLHEREAGTGGERSAAGLGA
ncbi:hypothetical protein [Nibricoccus sp. IMCC34717]|uniref:hypothetical protein n=1 Tax=Nibricoccus sp. IMCC34717 TaxID=3034021 RepID=UPI00384BAAF0